MFSFLKKLLFPEEDIPVVLEKERILFDEAASWLEQHTSQSAKSVAESVRPVLDKIDDALFANKANLSKLEHAELKNKNITSRELELMRGNRVSYIKRTQQFLEQLSSLYDKENITYADTKEFCEWYLKEIQVYHGATLKPYAVLQHFFGNETYAVAKNIKEIDELMKQLQLLMQKQSCESVTHVKQQITALQTKRKQKEQLYAEKKMLEEEMHRISQQEEQAEQKVKKVEETAGYQRYCMYVAQAKELEKKIHAHISHLTGSFSAIDKALRKYAKTVPEQEAFILSYLENPVQALQQDTTKEIVKLLAALREQILAESVELKEDKKEKTLQELDVLSASFFEEFQQQYQALLDEKKQADNLCSSDFAAQQYKEATYMHATYKEKTDAVRKQLAAVASQLEKANIERDLAQLQQDVQMCTKREVEIVLEEKVEEKDQQI